MLSCAARRLNVDTGGPRPFGKSTPSRADTVNRGRGQTSLDSSRDHLVQARRGRSGRLVPNWRRGQQFEYLSRRPLSGFVYDVGGYEIRSTFPLPGLRFVPHSDAVPAILVDASSGPAAEADRVLFRWPGQYGLTLSACGGGWLFSSAAHGVTVISSDGPGSVLSGHGVLSDWPELLAAHPPRLLQWHGRVAVHAATAADNEPRRCCSGRRALVSPRYAALDTSALAR